MKNPQEVIENVLYRTKDADLNSSNIKKSAHFFWHQNLKLKSLILHLFEREKLSKTHAFSLQSTQKVIEKVRFPT